MNIGRLDKRVEHHNRLTTTDEWNHAVIDWRLNTTMWATVTFRTGGEQQVGNQRVNVDRVVFTIRHRDDIDVLDRVKYDGRYFDIHSIETMGRGEAMRLITTARDNATSNI